MKNTYLVKSQHYNIISNHQNLELAKSFISKKQSKLNTILQNIHQYLENIESTYYIHFFFDKNNFPLKKPYHKNQIPSLFTSNNLSYIIKKYPPPFYPTITKYIIFHSLIIEKYHNIHLLYFFKKLKNLNILNYPNSLNIEITKIQQHDLLQSHQ